MFHFLHKRVLGNCHPLLIESFPFVVGLDANYAKALHPFTELVTYHSRLFFDRSMYSYIHIQPKVVVTPMEKSLGFPL